PTNSQIQNALAGSRQTVYRQLREEHLDPRLQPKTMVEQLDEIQEKFGGDPQQVRLGHAFSEKYDQAMADVVRGHKYEHGDIDIKQDYQQAAKYFARAAEQGNAEGMYNIARLTERGLGVKEDHDVALKWYKQAAAQPPKHPIYKVIPKLGVV
ncbi:unnamed protein product, partial [Adineta ricciae]